MPKPVVCQTWSESEAGWGQRPDGYSLHLNDGDRVSYVKEYNDSLPPRGPQGQPPSCYSFADSHYIVDIDEELYKKISKSKNGLGFNGKAPERS